MGMAIEEIAHYLIPRRYLFKISTAHQKHQMAVLMLDPIAGR